MLVPVFVFRTAVLDERMTTRKIERRVPGLAAARMIIIIDAHVRCVSQQYFLIEKTQGLTKKRYESSPYPMFDGYEYVTTVEHWTAVHSSERQ